jgi:hypothetical protein
MNPIACGEKKPFDESDWELFRNPSIGRSPCRQRDKGMNRAGQGTAETGPNDRKEASDCRFQELTFFSFSIYAINT